MTYPEMLVSINLLEYHAKYDLVTFDDIQGHWAQNSIEILATAGIIKGKTERLFVPDASITRAEFIALIVRALEYAMVRLLCRRYCSNKVY